MLRKMSQLIESNPMQSLSELAGFELDWAGDGTLRVGADIQVKEVLSRPLERLRAVALNPASCTPGDRVQYWMYNDLARRRDRSDAGEDARYSDPREIVVVAQARCVRRIRRRARTRRRTHPS